MCIIMGDPMALQRVSGTSIFAGARSDERQVLVYRMTVAATDAVAMVLPLPLPPDCDEDAVRFIDLSGYPRLFDDLERAFPVMMAESLAFGGMVPQATPSRTLVVHQVGSFEASFVPTRADFSRLDRRFRLPDEVWDALPQYADWGFAVFQLRGSAMQRGLWARLLGRRPKASSHQIHPMAFEFPRRDPAVLFFPTVHVHDGSMHPEASFDHTLYAQLRPGQHPAGEGWEQSEGALAPTVDPVRAADVIDGERPGFRRSILGMQPNEDTFVAPR